MSTISDGLPDIAEQDEKFALLYQEEVSRKPSCFKKQTWLVAVCAIILTNLLSIVFTARYIRSQSYLSYSLDLPRRLYPELDRSHILTQFSEHRVNGTSRWSAPPSPSVDRAWLELGVRDVGFLVPKTVGISHGLDPREQKYYPKGTYRSDSELEGFIVFVQAFHDLHCLDELRKALYFNKPYYRQYEDDNLVPEWFRVSHINHCLDNIRETLMCAADIGVIPTVWTGSHNSSIRFSNKHQCNSYDSLLEWKAKWDADHPAFAKELPEQFQAPPDAVFHDPNEWVV
ncbi:hypothetical protein COCVIDRAFT_18228 [Bipolaris victoriae FI3]|uniref:Tat pathway signal sequence n=1 Tax=Bipolaris victoriae (strain FI3) TaxID=930091 RepID=W7E1T8_BIPV3|nr:hypothetical protein COCVIDRAFT_18228 [Bipolaris victoriae FI3]